MESDILGVVMLTLVVAGVVIFFVWLACSIAYEAGYDKAANKYRKDEWDAVFKVREESHERAKREYERGFNVGVRETKRDIKARLDAWEI